MNKTLRELNRSKAIKNDDFTFKHSFIENLDQFNEGLEYFVDLIESIYRKIDQMIFEFNEYNVFMTALNESENPSWDRWQRAKEEIRPLEKEVLAICKILNDFLINGIVLKNNAMFRITTENCINSRDSIDERTEDVERIIDRYYKAAKKLNKPGIPYPLDDVIRIYNLSVDNFNEILDQYRSRFRIAIEELPDARKANIELIE